MGKYDKAAKKICDVLEGWWTSWLNSIKPMSGSQMPIRDLLFNHKIAEFTRLPPSCHSQAFTAPEAIVTAEDIDGIERQFDLRNLQQALVLVQDISGYERYVRVRTLTDVLSNHGAGMQLQPPYIVIPAMAMPSESTFSSNIFINQENLWRSDIV
jgi:hypothetical protein